MLINPEDIEQLNGPSLLQNRLRIVMALQAIRDAGMPPPAIYASNPEKPDTPYMLETGPNGELRMVIGRNIEIIDHRHKALDITPESAQALTEALEEAGRKKREQETEKPELRESFRIIMEPTHREITDIVPTIEAKKPAIDIQEQRRLLTEHLAKHIFSEQSTVINDGIIRFTVATHGVNTMAGLIQNGNFHRTRIKIRSTIFDAIAGNLTMQILREAEKTQGTSALRKLGSPAYGLAWYQTCNYTFEEVLIMNQPYTDEHRVKVK